MPSDQSKSYLNETSLSTNSAQNGAREDVVRVRSIEDPSRDPGSRMVSFKLISCSSIAHRTIDAAFNAVKSISDEYRILSLSSKSLSWDIYDMSIAVLQEEDIEIFCKAAPAPPIPEDSVRLQLAFIQLKGTDNLGDIELWNGHFDRLRKANVLPVVCHYFPEQHSQYGSAHFALVSLFSALTVMQTPCVDYYDVAYVISQRRSAYVTFCSVPRSDYCNLARWIDKKSMGCLAICTPDPESDSFMDDVGFLDEQLHDAINESADIKVTFREPNFSFVGDSSYCAHVFQSVHI